MLKKIVIILTMMCAPLNAISLSKITKLTVGAGAAVLAAASVGIQYALISRISKNNSARKDKSPQQIQSLNRRNRLVQLPFVLVSAYSVYRIIKATQQPGGIIKIGCWLAACGASAFVQSKVPTYFEPSLKEQLKK